MYEILVGRTPFEEHEQEDFAEEERVEEYQRRVARGRWWGKYSIPSGESRVFLRADSPVYCDLLRAMICPDPTRRITAEEAYQRLWKLTPTPSVETPTFVRVAKGERKQRPHETTKSTRKTRPVLAERERNEESILKPTKSVSTLKRVRVDEMKTRKEDMPPKETQRELSLGLVN